MGQELRRIRSKIYATVGFQRPRADMDTRDFPDGFVILRTRTKNCLQNAYGTHRAACTSDHIDSYVWMMICPRDDDGLYIHSMRGSCGLTVRPSGECFFASSGSEHFVPRPCQGGWINFVSSKTGKCLMVDQLGDVWCHEREAPVAAGMCTEWEMFPPRPRASPSSVSGECVGLITGCHSDRSFMRYRAVLLLKYFLILNRAPLLSTIF
jgi:hypothetical protein